MSISLVSTSEIQGETYGNVNEGTIELRKLDLSADSLVKDLLNDVFSDCEPSSSGRFYYLYLEEYESGVKAYVVQEHKNMIDRNKLNHRIGYLPLGTDTVIVSGTPIEDIIYSTDSQPLRLPICEYMRNDSPEWLYFIKDGIFARDAESMGWIWYIPKDELSNFTLTKYGVTAPARSKK